MTTTFDKVLPRTASGLINVIIDTPKRQPQQVQI